MEKKTQNKFYLDLKNKRESQGIKISEISEQTKINPKYFKAFEKGEFDILPVVYARLFLRSYAIEIGSNPDEVLEHFELHTTGKVKPKNIINQIRKTEKLKSDSKSAESFFNDESFFQNINQKNLIGGLIALLVIFMLLSKLRDITQDSTQSEINNNITTKNKTIDTKDEKAIPGSYLDGFQKIDSKSIKLNLSPPYSLTFSSIEASDVKLKIIENGITTLDRILPLKPASNLTRESNGIFEFKLKSTKGISISLNEDKEIISQFLKPENISDEDLAIQVILSENGNLKADYFKITQ
ncbi:MAG: helix-turn-helix domain-containing protein [Candidatus Neomarinimicrobiota bacterium]|jgi:cytoskeletal protein RodZ|nr:helix-turn-helix domain-containing protein [Candidatus Neomarinimicrobiota bacterium]